MFGFLTNAVYIVLLSFTLLIRVPGLGLMVEFIRTIPTEHFRAWLHGWLDDKPLRRAYTIVTVLWIGVFALRLIVQVPLYLADSVALLGTARLLMGIPFWALAIWVIVSDHRHPAAPAHRRGQAGRPAGKDDDNDGRNSGDEGDNAAGQALSGQIAKGNNERASAYRTLCRPGTMRRAYRWPCGIREVRPAGRAGAGRIG